MPKGYWIVHIDVTDPAAYEAYRNAVAPYLAANAGRFVVRAGRSKLVEGALKPRHVVIEFPDYEMALSAYESAEYQAIKALRLKPSRADFVVVEGA